MNNDKSKVIMLISIILLTIVLIVAFIFIAFLDLKEENENNNLSTTTRRTVSTTTTDILENELTTTTLPIETSTTTSKITTTTSSTTTSKKVTTTKRVSTTEPIEDDIIPIPDSRETTTEPTIYPDSVDEWEWAIVNYINEERRRNGLEPLAVAKDLRQLAEEGADLWMGYGDQVVKEYLYGNSNYRMYTNLASDTAYTFYERTVAATNVTTDPYLSYLGVGVLLKSRGLSGLPTYYYVIIYE